MPDATVLEQHGLTTLPPDAPPHTWDPREVAHAFARVFENFKISQTGEAIRYTSAVSNLIGWAITSDTTKLTGDDLAVAQFVKHYLDVLSDAVDFAEATPLHENRPRRLTDKEITEYARMNQLLAQDYFYLNGTSATEDQRQNASDFFEFVTALPHLDMLRDVAASQLHGAQAQAGLMRLLTDDGWSVYVPDIINPDEIKTWDVEGDVDLVVWKPGLKKVLLLNSKGRWAEDEGADRQQLQVAKVEHYPFEESNPRAPIHYGIMSQVKNSLKNEGHTDLPERFTWLRVTVPTSRDYLSSIGVITDQHIRQSLLDQLVTLGQR